MSPRVLIAGAIFSCIGGILNPAIAQSALTAAIVLTWMGMAIWADQ